MIIQKITRAFIGLILFLCLSNINAQKVEINGNKFTVAGNEIWFNGINIPWKGFGSFGRQDFSASAWDAEFQRAAENNVNLIRLWIHCGGEFDPDINEEGFVTGANEYFWRNVDSIFSIAKRHKIYIMPALLSFDVVDGTKQYVTVPRWNLWVSSEENVQSYIDNILIPLVEKYDNEDYLLGWEICNEPEWMGDGSKASHFYGDIIRFHGMMAAAIHRHGTKPVTTGSAGIKWHSPEVTNLHNPDYPPPAGHLWADDSLKKYANDEEAYFDFYQIHWYPWQYKSWNEISFYEAPYTPEYFNINDRPVIIGETEGKDVDIVEYVGNTRIEFHQTLIEMFENSYQLGYAGICPWVTEGGDGHGTYEAIYGATNDFYSNHQYLVHPSLIPIPVEGIEIDPASISIEQNDDYYLNVIITPERATNQKIYFSVNNGNVTIDSNGVVFGKLLGNSVITARSDDGNFTATCNITVNEDLPDPIYNLTINKTGQGEVIVEPNSNSFPKGTEVTLTASAAGGYAFDNWSGTLNNDSYATSIIMDSDKTIGVTFIEKAGKCENPIEIESFPFEIDGAGEYCYSTNKDIKLINSWSTDLVEINGVDYTNTWAANGFPAKIEGKSFIYYNCSANSAHFEIAQVDENSSNSIPTIETNTGIIVAAGGNGIIESSNLSAEDKESDNETLLYSITRNTKNGTIENINNPGTTIYTFSQQEINENEIRYIHDNSNTSKDYFKFRVSDGEDNSSELTFEIAISDNIGNEAPEIISTHSNVEINGNSNCQALLPDYTSTVILAGSSAGVTFEQMPIAGTIISGTTNEVTLTARLSASLFDEVSFNASVIDNTNPVISSTHANINLEGNASGEVELPDYTSSIIATDNCSSNLTITQNPIAGAIISGNGNRITLEVTDDAGNSATKTFMINVSTPGSPVITSIHNDTEISSNSNCQSELPDYIGQVTIEGGNAGTTITQNPAAGTLLSGRTNEVTITATSSLGLSASISFNIAVIDDIAPVITSSHPNQELDGGESGQIELPDYRSFVVASDNCDDALDINQNPEPETVLSGNSNIVTLTVSDDEGNTAVATFNISVSKTATAPVITSVHPNKELNGTMECSAILPDYTGNVIIEGGNAGITVTQTPISGSLIIGSTNNITLTATNSAGLSSSVSFNVAVVDNTGPLIASVFSDTELAGNIYGEASLPDYTSNVIAADNCDNDLVFEQFPAAGSTVSGSHNTIRINVSDNSGNTTSTTFNVSVSQPSAPVITSVHNNKTLISNDSCFAVLPDYTLDVIVEDNEDVTIVQTPVDGTIITGDTNLVTLTVTNFYGLTATASFNVAVVDEIAPEIASNLAIEDLLGNSDGETQLPDYTGEVEASDNCDDDIAIIQFPEPGTIISGNNNIISITASDNAGNKSAVIFTISVDAATQTESVFTNNINIFPNPSKGIINIEGSGIEQISIYNSTGKTIKTIDVDYDNPKIDLSGQSEGLYYIMISTKNGNTVSKIILE